MRKTCKLLVCGALMAALVPAWPAGPAVAQGYGGGAWESCQAAGGQPACRQRGPAAAGYGTRAYERWGDGSPAFGSGAPDTYQFPHYLGGYNSM